MLPFFITFIKNKIESFMKLLLCITSIMLTNNALCEILNSDQEAYNFCISHPHSYIVIVWPIAQGKDKEIKKICAAYGLIHYEKRVYLSQEQAYYLLKKVHPHIADINEHVTWYFPDNTFKKKARIFVFTCLDHSQVVACKYAIRRLFKLQYRSIHINDTHAETLELAKFFLCDNLSIL